MDYSKMSDQEINMAVAESFHPESMVIESKSRPPIAFVTGHLPRLWVDYCNNPADAWPIIMERKLTIKPDIYIGGWVAMESKHDETEAIYSAGENPLRAAMIVFLMMQESANVPANSTGSDIR